jgi:hypothetical protein
MRSVLIAFGIVGLVTAAAAAARADDYVLTITVINEDATPEEFESNPMKVEKVIAGKSKGAVRIGPLKPGRYPFIGEYNEATAKGTVIAE